MGSSGRACADCQWFWGQTWLLRGPVSGDIDLTTQADAVLSGEGTDDGDAGEIVSSAGDVDADGYDDILLGVLDDEDGRGAAYLFLSPVSGARSLGTADARLVGEDDHDRAGSTVGGAGDMDGDGFGDLVIGAPSNDPDGDGHREGACYLLDGPLSGELSLSAADAKFVGDGGLGWTPASSGDANGDGYGDLLLGAVDSGHAAEQAGAVYLLLGPFEGEVDVTLAAEAELTGEGAEDLAGLSVALGDMDADGLLDIAVGSLNHEGGADAGAVYLAYAPVSGLVPLAEIDAKFLGPSGSAACRAVSAGDTDADGRADLLVGAPFDDEGGSDAGAAFLLPGLALAR